MEEQFTMAGGSGLFSYSKNSNFQRKGIETAKELINKSIAEKLDFEIFSSSSTFRIADLGCAAGPRAQEIVYGGLLAFIVHARRDGTPHSEVFNNKIIELLGSCLLDMANKGKIIRDDVDSFNLPYYFASPEEVEAVVKRNGCFSIETIESLQHGKPRLRGIWSTFRGAVGGGIKKHFGEEILDELFDLLYKKLEENSSWILEVVNAITIFVLLKRISKEV